MSLDQVGRIENGHFVMPVRVYYEDTDAGGVVYYANYLKYAERARTEMLRHLGISNRDLQNRHGVAFVVSHIDAKYLQPAHLDDVLDVRLSIMNVGGASMDGVQTIERDGTALVVMNIRLGCMKLTGGPGRIPADIRKLLQTIDCKHEHKDRE